MKEKYERKKFFSFDNIKTLLKAKWAFLLSYWFNRPFPVKYHKMAVNLQCCSAYGLKRLLCNHTFSPEARENMLIKLVQQRAFSVLELYFKAKHRTTFNLLPLSVWMYIIDTNDMDMFKTALLGKAHVPDVVIARILRNRQYDMFEIYCKFKPDDGLEYFDVDGLLLHCDHIPTLEIAAVNLRSVPSLIALAQKNQMGFLHSFFSKYSLDTGRQRVMIASKNKKLIACYIQHSDLDVLSLKLLVKYKFKDLLKLYYQKYAIPDEVLAYQANLHNFETFIGIEKND